MEKHLLMILASAAVLSGCGTINETIRTLECNRQAIEMSTCAIQDNIQAIEEVNRSIEENQRQIEAVTQSLKIKGTIN